MPAAARGLTVSDGSELVGWGVGGSGLAIAIGKFIWDSVRNRKDQLEKKVEEDAADRLLESGKKIDTVLAKLGALELDLRELLTNQATQTGALAEVKARVEGISTNHGGRLGTIEQALVELRTRLVSVEQRPPRRK